MNEDNSCLVHPKEDIVGVCHHCLNQRILQLILAIKQSHHPRTYLPTVVVSKSSHHHNLYTSSSSSSHNLNQYYNNTHIKSPNYILAFATSVLARSSCYSTHASATPDQDSFISIKFGENGVASWDKGNSVSKVSLDHCNISWNKHKTTKLETNTTNRKESRNVIIHSEMPRGGSMWWRKRIGHMFQLIRWKRSSCNSANRGTRTQTKEGSKNKVLL